MDLQIYKPGIDPIRRGQLFYTVDTTRLRYALGGIRGNALFPAICRGVTISPLDPSLVDTRSILGFTKAVPAHSSVFHRTQVVTIKSRGPSNNFASQRLSPEAVRTGWDLGAGPYLVSALEYDLLRGGIDACAPSISLLGSGVYTGRRATVIGVTAKIALIEYRSGWISSNLRAVSLEDLICA